MLNYKELQQLLQPIHEFHDNQSHQQHQVNQMNAQNQPQPKYSLNLSHRQLRKVPPLIPFKQYPIQQLNLSFNFLKDLKSFNQLTSPTLQYLNLSFNFLTTFDKLGRSFQSLTTIDLNANRITSVEMTDKQFPVLEALYLKNNKIKFFLHCPNSVEILCLDHNQLEVLAFTGGSNVEILSASCNKIQDVEIENVQNLNFLDLQQNKVSDIEKLKKLVQKAPNLLSLNMIGNYVSKINHKKYLIQMLVICPILVKVDEIIINPHVRQAFKVMREEDKMELQMKQTQEKYRYRMQEQLRLKEELIQKLRQEQAGIENKFQEFMKKQKQQLDVLQNYAKNNMGKKIMAVVDENKPFNKLASQYNKKPLEQLDQPSNNASKLRHHLDYLPSEETDRDGQQPQERQGQVDPQQLGNELTRYLVQGIIISKHKDEYNEYKKAKKQQHNSKQSKIKKYLGMEDDKKNNSKQSKENKNESKNDKQNPHIYEDDDEGRDQDGDGFNDSMSDEDDQLSPQEKQRRKKNMRNPGLVYRNSNELIGAPAINIDEDLSSDEEFAFNKKCLPYLVKNYGFHTVV